ncbi:MAG: hypothetical protein H6728_03470 [Myxococcales bacterium]|nr:hypothetical protein [Myxococcales bacterium]MCB9642110.1 hypothetical protein [Myxococcales bacterium]
MSLGQPLPPEPRFRPQPITVGTILSNTFQVLGANLIPFLVLSCLMLLPGIAFIAYRIMNVNEMSGQELQMYIGVTVLIFGALQVLLQVPAQSAMMFGVANQMSGRSTDLGHILRRGFASIIPVLGTSFVVMLALMGSMLACVIPVFIVMTILFVAIPVAVVEDLGISGNLRRSSYLTEGYRWTIFWSSIAIGFGTSAIQQVIQRAAASTGSITMILAASVIVSIVTLPIQSVMSAVTYMLLRQEKDSINVDDIADVFR